MLWYIIQYKKEDQDRYMKEVFGIHEPKPAVRLSMPQQEGSGINTFSEIHFPAGKVYHGDIKVYDQRYEQIKIHLD